MARKRLIKGANAARVEERIARVPADVTILESGPESSIFDALRALEGSSTPPKAAPARGRKPAPPPEGKPESIPEPESPAKPGRVGPSDFTAAEREEIVRCCSDYRNRLPTYLLAVQKEVEVIDSVIGKCRSVTGRSRKP